jgi:thiol-disulfide isomerase/thioredoxin
MRLLTIALCATLALPAAAEDEVGVGLPVPSFRLPAMNPDVAGTRIVAVDDLVGAEPTDDGAKLLVISFFASWCGPCKKEMPFLIQLDKMYREQGLRIVGVCLDKEEPGISDAKKLIAEKKVTYPVALDRMHLVARRFFGSVTPLPAVFLVRRDGNVALIEKAYTKDVSAFLLGEIQKELGLKAAPLALKAEEPKHEAKAAGSELKALPKKAGAKPDAKVEAKAEPTAKPKAEPTDPKPVAAEPAPPKS